MKRDDVHLPDTNVIVRYLVNDDPALFMRAQVFFDKVRQGDQKAVLLESVLAECVYVLTKIYKVPRTEAASVLIDLLQYKGICNTDKAELIHALNLYSAKNLDVVDAILCAKAQDRQRTLVTFDKALQKVSNAQS